MTTKPFDCVEMKRRGAELLRERTAVMTHEEEVEYWKKRNAEFRQEEKGIPLIPATGRPGLQKEIDDAVDAI